MKKLAIFASGNGSNTQNIIEHFKASTTARVEIVICNKPGAYVLERAAVLGVPSALISKEELVADEPVQLLALLQQHSIDYIVLAGYLLKIPQALVEAYSGRIINIHPALLPKFGGKGMYGKHVHQAVIDAGEPESGITIHLVDAHYDSGAHIFQAACPVFPTDTPDILAQRIHALEKEHFPAIIEKYIEKKCGVTQ